jgi:hypothetical protein
MNTFHPTPFPGSSTEAQDNTRLQYLEQTGYLLGVALDLYRKGDILQYRPAAVLLRLLLCDKNRIHDKMVDTGLLSLVYPDLRLRLPIEQGFPNSAEVDLKQWLTLAFHDSLPSDWSIRRLIKYICEKDGGAHVDHQNRPKTTPDFDTVHRVIMQAAEVVMAYLGK